MMYALTVRADKAAGLYVASVLALSAVGVAVLKWWMEWP